jgi:hypothetical protein
MKKQHLTNYNFLINNQVLSTPLLDDQAIRNWGNNLNNIIAHYDSYLLNLQIPNSPGPIEKHPYIDLYATDCDFQRETLLLGTFPPSSYLNNMQLANIPNPNVQNNNPTNYFYGNMNDLWDYLFGLNGNNVTIGNIHTLLNENSISISDVFAYVQRKNMINPEDKEYVNIVINCNLRAIFYPESNIKTLLFTSGSLRKLLSNTTSTLTGFRWILEECCEGLNNFTISGDLNGNGIFYPVNKVGIQNALIQQNGGIVWWLKFGTKKIRIINLPSPAPTASLRITSSPFYIKWINHKATANQIQPIVLGANVNQYLNQFPHVFIQPYTKQYRREIYQMVLNNTIDLIQ